MSYTAVYIVDSQIRDALVLPFKTNQASYWEAVLEETDKEMVDMAETFGIGSASIKTPVHNTIQNYLVAYFVTTILSEKMGYNDVEGLVDKYEHKLKVMWGIMAQLRKQITSEMIAGLVESAGDRSARSITRFRT